MFSAFAMSEVKAVRDWIDALPRQDQVYWDVVGQPQRLYASVFYNQDTSVDYPVFLPRTVPKFNADPSPSRPQLEPAISGAVNAKNINLKCLLPLWFAHPTLLERFVAILQK